MWYRYAHRSSQRSTFHLFHEILTDDQAKPARTLAGWEKPGAL